MTPMEAKFASIGGTRQMIADDSFALLVALLVDCGAVPANVMAGALRGLADRLVRKAAGQLPTDWQVHSGEVTERILDLHRLASQIEARDADRSRLQTSRRPEQTSTAVR